MWFISRLILFLFFIISTACFYSEGERPTASKVVLLAGQSNAQVCEWSILRNSYRIDVIPLRVGGRSISGLLKNYPLYQRDLVKYILAGRNVDAVFMIHGEADGRLATPSIDYVAGLVRYHGLIAGSLGYEVPLLINAVGYNYDYDPVPFDAIRRTVQYSSLYDNWYVAYDGAPYFAEKGMLHD